MKWLIIVLSLLIPKAYGSKNICQILPPNNIKISTKNFTGISASEFKEILKEFSDINAQMIKEKGYTLILKDKWLDNTVNADTEREDKKLIINAYGGLARFKGMDPDTYTMVLCHELGHHFGGFPRKGWASNEGQSDYYATMKCFRKMPYSKKIIKNPPPIVKEKCSLLHKSKDDINVCITSTMIGFNLADILNRLSEGKKTLDFNTPDEKQVNATFHGHPEAQCRLDTYFAGAICNMSQFEDFDEINPIIAACAEEKGDILGIRPRCWYKPKY